VTTHEEAEAAVSDMETWRLASDHAHTVVAYWREHIQPAVPPVPDGCELVVDADGVPVFRAPADDDYGYLNIYGFLCLTASPLPHPTDTFAGKRYIVRHPAPTVPTDVERLAQALAESTGMMWGGLPASEGERYVRAAAQNLYDLGVRCPEQTP